MPERLNQDQIAIVLRRAAELDRDVGSGGQHGLDEAAVEAAAVEAGLSLPAVRRALAEYRVGLLDRPRDHRPRGLLGPATLVVTRTVPGPTAEVERHLHRFLDDQLFELRRDHGSRTTWIRRRSLEATARRAIDRAVQRRLILREVNHIDVSVLDNGEPWVVVRLDVDVLAARHAQGTLAGSAAVVGGGLTVGTAAAAFSHPAFLVLASAGAGVAGAGHWAGTRLYRHRVEDIQSGLDGILDRLERGERSRSRGRR
ncbi:MAG: hypothetical protein ACRD2W_16265 [Acidimicrobiales bacterium]